MDVDGLVLFPGAGSGADHPSLLVIESQRQQFRLRFHSEPECVARFGSPGSGQPAQPHGDGIDGWQGRASVRANEPRHQESHAA